MSLSSTQKLTQMRLPRTEHSALDVSGYSSAVGSGWVGYTYINIYFLVIWLIFDFVNLSALHTNA